MRAIQGAAQDSVGILQRISYRTVLHEASNFRGRGEIDEMDGKW